MHDTPIRRLPAWLVMLIVLVQAHGALNAEPRWPQFRGPDADGRSRDGDVPVRWTPDDVAWRTELVLNGEFGVTGYDPESGRELWFCKGFNGRGTPTPLFEDGLLYVISAKKGDTFALRPGGSGDVTDSHMAWHTPRPLGRNLASPVIEEDRILTVSMEGRAYC